MPPHPPPQSRAARLVDVAASVDHELRSLYLEPAAFALALALIFVLTYRYRIAGGCTRDHGVGSQRHRRVATSEDELDQDELVRIRTSRESADSLAEESERTSRCVVS